MPLDVDVGLGPGHIVLDGDLFSLPKTTAEPPPQFLAHVCCGQTAGWIKMPLGTKVGLEAALSYLGTQLPLQKGAPPNFWHMSIVDKR